MTKEEARRYWKELEALKDGKVIQARSLTGYWCDVESPMFESTYEFRVKPEPREWWIVADRSSACTWSEIYFSRPDAEIRLGKISDTIRAGYEIIHVREIPNG